MNSTPESLPCLLGYYVIFEEFVNMSFNQGIVEKI